jgi:hypothetical protein
MKWTNLRLVHSLPRTPLTLCADAAARHLQPLGKLNQAYTCAMHSNSSTVRAVSRMPAKKRRHARSLLK